MDGFNSHTPLYTAHLKTIVCQDGKIMLPNGMKMDYLFRRNDEVRPPIKILYKTYI